MTWSTMRGLAPSGVLVGGRILPLQDPVDQCEIVTGASRGIGRAVATRFVHQGAFVGVVQRGPAPNMSYLGRTNVSRYAASGRGVALLTKALASGWGDHGIRVNAAAPGWIAVGTPDEVAAAVSVLVSPEADCIHDHVLTVDGGYPAR